MITLSLHSTFAVGGDDKEKLDQETDAVADALIDLENVHAGLLDSSVSTDLDARTVEITLTVMGEDFENAERIATECVMTAVNSAGGSMKTAPEFRITSKSSELVHA